MIENADMAMYRAKDLGRGRFACYDRGMRLQATQLGAAQAHAAVLDALGHVDGLPVGLPGAQQGCIKLPHSPGRDRSHQVPILRADQVGRGGTRPYQSERAVHGKHPWSGAPARGP